MKYLAGFALLFAASIAHSNEIVNPIENSTIFSKFLSKHAEYLSKPEYIGSNCQDSYSAIINKKYVDIKPVEMFSSLEYAESFIRDKYRCNSFIFQEVSFYQGDQQSKAYKPQAPIYYYEFELDDHHYFALYPSGMSGIATEQNISPSFAAGSHPSYYIYDTDKCAEFTRANNHIKYMQIRELGEKLTLAHGGLLKMPSGDIVAYKMIFFRGNAFYKYVSLRRDTLFSCKGAVMKHNYVNPEDLDRECSRATGCSPSAAQWK